MKKTALQKCIEYLKSNEDNLDVIVLNQYMTEVWSVYGIDQNFSSKTVKAAKESLGLVHIPYSVAQRSFGPSNVIYDFPSQKYKYGLK